MPEALVNWLSGVARELALYDDTGAVLDRILFEARAVCCADAGTVFLQENGKLVFSYTHNDTLFPVETAHKYAYASAHLPLDATSIAGYCAVTRQPLNLSDVRRLPEKMPFSFNDAFDLATGYRTVSVFALPLLGRKSNVLGVLQLINSKGSNGPRAFTDTEADRLALLGVHAVSALERSILAREMIHRMQSMASLSDPKETGPHAERVGAIAAEIYRGLATRTGVPVDISRAYVSQLRLAAMVHDLGKVAIPREILKKPGRLTEDEFRVMQTHCAEGAKLFHAAELDVDAMSREIAQHHHQKWNGHGYTGDPQVPVLAGEEIPLSARITAVADVFDALVSRRCYKPAWDWQDAVAQLRHDAGSHFDPAMVEAFLDVEDIVRRIFERYPDATSK